MLFLFLKGSWYHGMIHTAEFLNFFEYRYLHDSETARWGLIDRKGGTKSCNSLSSPADAGGDGEFRSG